MMFRGGNRLIPRGVRDVNIILSLNNSSGIEAVLSSECVNNFTQDQRILFLGGMVVLQILNSVLCDVFISASLCFPFFRGLIKRKTVCYLQN